MPTKPRRPLPGLKPNKPAPAVHTRPSSGPSVSEGVSELAKVSLAQMKEWEQRIAACVQAANEMLGIQPAITAHQHKLHLGICASTIVPLNPHFLLFCVHVSQTEAMRGTGVPAVPAANLPAPASVPVSGDIEARLARMEIRLGSLLSFAPELDGLATAFGEHFHPYPFSWGPVLATIDNPGAAIHTPGAAWHVTDGPSVSPPTGIDPQGELPRPGTPMTQLALGLRIARVASVLADIEPLYGRVSAAARSFADHVHPIKGSTLTAATLMQPITHPSYVLAKTVNDGDFDFMTAVGRPR